MKIAIDCRFIGKSGIGTYIENIVEELCRNHPEHDYLLVVEQGNNIYSTKSNVQILETNIKPFSLNEIFCFPVEAINQCEAYFTPYINIPGNIRIPTYSTIHDVIFLDLPELTSALGRIIRKWFIGRAIRKSNSLFTVSEFSKNRIINHFNTGKEIEVTFSAISKHIKKYTEDNAQINKGDYIIYVGNIKRHKGLKILLEAFTKACETGYNKILYVVGDGDKMRTADHDVAAYVNGNDRIRFTGFIPNEQMYKLIQDAEALVLPTLYEGFGLTPLEALYLGTDVIISDIQVLKEVYENLPVTYFKAGDSNCLKEKLLEGYAKIKDVEELREKIDEIYNFKDIANKIIRKIEGL